LQWCDDSATAVERSRRRGAPLEIYPSVKDRRRPAFDGLVAFATWSPIRVRHLTCDDQMTLSAAD